MNAGKPSDEKNKFTYFSSRWLIHRPNAKSLGHTLRGFHVHSLLSEPCKSCPKLFLAKGFGGEQQ